MVGLPIAAASAVCDRTKQAPVAGGHSERSMNSSRVVLWIAAELGKSGILAQEPLTVIRSAGENTDGESVKRDGAGRYAVSRRASYFYRAVRLIEDECFV